MRAAVMVTRVAGIHGSAAITESDGSDRCENDDGDLCESDSDPAAACGRVCCEQRPGSYASVLQRPTLCDANSDSTTNGDDNTTTQVGGEAGECAEGLVEPTVQ